MHLGLGEWDRPHCWREAVLHSPHGVVPHRKRHHPEALHVLQPKEEDMLETGGLNFSHERRGVLRRGRGTKSIQRACLMLGKIMAFTSRES